MIPIPGIWVRAILHDSNGAVHDIKLECSRVRIMKPLIVIYVTLCNYRIRWEDIAKVYRMVRQWVQIKFANWAAKPENVDTRDKFDLDSNG